MITHLIQPLAHKVILGLLVALALLMWRADQISGQRDKARDALASERMRHDATRASYFALEAHMARLVREGQLRATARDEAVKQARRANEATLRNAELLGDGRTDVRGLGL